MLSIAIPVIVSLAIIVIAWLVMSAVRQWTPDSPPPSLPPFLLVTAGKTRQIGWALVAACAIGFIVHGSFLVEATHAGWRGSVAAMDSRAVLDYDAYNFTVMVLDAAQYAIAIIVGIALVVEGRSQSKRRLYPVADAFH